MTLQVSQAIGSSSMRSGDPRQTLRENGATAGSSSTAQSPGGDVDDDCASLPWQVTEYARVAAMDAIRRMTADRTHGSESAGAGRDHDPLRIGGDLIDDQAGGNDGEKVSSHRHT